MQVLVTYCQQNAQRSIFTCGHERDEVEDSNAEESGFLIVKLNKRTKTTPRGEKKQAGRQAVRRLVHSQTRHTLSKTHERQRISTGLQTPGG